MTDIPITDIINFLHNYINRSKVEEPAQKVMYPKYIPYNFVGVEFSQNLSITNKIRVENIIAYWSHISYVGRVSSFGWKSDKDIIIEVSEEGSSSKNPRARKPLELLLEFIENGTPMRANDTRAHVGIVPNVLTIKGY